MADMDFYIDKAPQVSPKTPKDPKPLQGRWWKYGLVFAVVQVGLWLLLGFRLNPEFSFSYAFRIGFAVYGMFIFLSFLPFILGRMGLTRMMWFVAVGVLSGMAVYYLLALYEPTRRFNLLPFISYLQFSFAGISLGFLWEFGRWVFKKLKE